MQVHTYPRTAAESERPTSVLVFGGSVFSRIGIVAVLDQGSGLRVVGHASTCADIRSLVSERRPDVVVLDGESDPAPAIRALAGITAAPRVLVLASCRKRAARQGRHLDVPGIRVNLTDMTTLLPAVRLLRSGHQVVSALPAPGGRAPSAAVPQFVRERLQKLTGREVEVLHLMLRGWSNPEIADALVLSGATVKSHVHNLMNKLQLRSRVDVIITAYATGLVRAGVPATGHRRRPGGPARHSIRKEERPCPRTPVPRCPRS